jgi:hypothetical protein
MSVNVDIALLSGQLGREVVVRIFTAPDSAQSKISMHVKYSSGHFSCSGHLFNALYVQDAFYVLGHLLCSDTIAGCMHLLSSGHLFMWDAFLCSVQDTFLCRTPLVSRIL